MELDIPIERIQARRELGKDFELSERKAIQIVWWIGLAGALVLTLAILKEVALVLRALLNIRQLAEVTREAAGGIVENLRAIAKLPGLAPPLEKVGRQSAVLAETAASIERKIGSLAPVAGKRG